MKAKKHSREWERLRALHSFRVLDTGPDALLDQLVALARELLDVPIALVSLVDGDRQWFKARAGFEACQTSLEASFCAHAILDNTPLIVEDARADPRFADNPLVASDGSAPSVCFYAGAPLIAADGLPLGTFCVLDHHPRRFDERDRHRLSLLRDQAMALLERHRLYAEAERRTRRMGEWLAHVSHEIRTPLAAVLGYAELLDGSVERDEERDAVRAILRNAEHQRRIVDDLLDLSRIEAGRLEISRVPFALADLLSDIDDVMRPRVRGGPVAWRVECPEPLPLEIRTDALRVRQILFNLVANALKFTERGEIVLVVTQPAPGTSLDVEFAVRDTGIGMSAEQLARVFSRFEQGAADTAARFGGAGLGLSISHALAALLGGVLEVESRPGVGSVFRLRLGCAPPRGARRVPPLRSASVARERPSGPTPSTVLARCRLLIVDDHEDLRRVAEHALVRAGAQVVGVGSGDDALAHLRSSAHEAERGADVQAFDALLLDMQMPGLDGFGVLAAMSAAGIDLPVIAVTAGALKPQRERYLAAGCRGCVIKPFTAEALVSAVQEALAGSESRAVEGIVARASSPSRRMREDLPHVLIVDDSDDLSAALARLLTRHGYRVDTAGTGAAALAFVTRSAPHCIVLDRELPDMQSTALLAGFRMCETLHGTRYLSLSGTPMNEAERQALGFDAHLGKPVRSAALLAALRELLGTRSSP